MSSRQVLRFSAALPTAAGRKALRAAAIDVAGAELVVASSTATRAISQSGQTHLDAVVVHCSLPDATRAIRALDGRRDQTKLFMISPKPARAAKLYSIGRDQIISAAGSVDQVSASIMSRITEMVSKRGLQAQVTDDAHPAPAPAPIAAAPAPVATSLRAPARKQAIAGEIVVLGSSTGGPEALARLLGDLPGDFPVPIVIVQHMPPDFTKMFADRLDRDFALRVREVTEPVRAKAGEVWIAPGHRHIKLVSNKGHLEVDDGPAENNCKPAVDVLFRSAAEHYGPRAVGVVLTGMGDDGTRGGQLMSQSGAFMIAQDEASSVVWGMPGSILRAGAVDSVQPLRRIGSELCQRVLANAASPSAAV